MQRPSPDLSSPPETVRVCDFRFISLFRPTHLGFGDPERSPKDTIWEDMLVTEQLTAGNMAISAAASLEL
ncbi:hypothetical protein DPSP01_010593 [Paraphaeosphaeria sporulosa]